MDPVSLGRRTRCGILVLAWLTVTGAVGDCAFFKPAVPESPNKPPIIPHYDTPTLTLQTLAKGIEDKSQSNGQSVYLGAFAESTAASTGDGRAFHAFFDPRDLQEHPTWPRTGDWNKELEPLMYADLVRKYSNPYLMTWHEYQPNGDDDVGADYALLHRKYKIVQVAKNGTTTDTLPVAIGTADLYFVKSTRAANKWVIAKWQDWHTRNDPDSAQVTLGKRRLETQ